MGPTLGLDRLEWRDLCCPGRKWNISWKLRAEAGGKHIEKLDIDGSVIWTLILGNMVQNVVGSVMGKKCNGKKSVDTVIILSADRASCRRLVLADWPFVKAAGCIAGQLTGLFAFHFTSFITYLSFHIYPNVINSLRLPSLSSPHSDFQL